MSIIIFIILLAVLVLVHEVGHFLAAKSVGARVDEFGIGFPPRLYSWRPEGSETLYSINAIPFGGFVKILGENGADEMSPEESARALPNKSRLAQVWVLSAGVIFNTVFAWILISIGFMVGFPSVVTPDTQGLLSTPEVMVLAVSPDSPAEGAGVMPGDVIVGLQREGVTQKGATSVEEVQQFIGSATGEEITLLYTREGKSGETLVTPLAGIVADRGAIGISLDLIGTVRLPLHKAFIEGALTTWRLIVATTVGLFDLIRDAVVGDADLSQVSGPVGIVGMVGDAAERGFMTLLSFAAVISLNLAVINLIPFPALDGGRILFVILEAIFRRPIPLKVSQWTNLAGFAILIIFMLLITVHDVIQLFA